MYVRYKRDIRIPEHLAGVKDSCHEVDDATGRRLIASGHAYELPHDKAVQVFGLEPEPIEPISIEYPAEFEADTTGIGWGMSDEITVTEEDVDG